jgi:hypothetical protein
MKTNLDLIYKTNKENESGTWFQVSEGVLFHVKRFGGSNSKKVKLSMAKYFDPYAKQIELGILEQEKEDEIMMTVFAESCVLDWKGVEIDGVTQPFSKENCITLFKSLPDLAKILIEYASDFKNFKDDVKN